VNKVMSGSPGESMGIRAGDRLIAINGSRVGDILDYQFYSADEVLDFTFFREGKERRIRVKKKEGEDLGFEFEPMRFRKCGNRCIFCFVDQNPKGLRSSLYVKDEDFRLSFLHGNYVTLTYVSQSDLERILAQKLSPLYVSVHATDPEVRKKLLGLKHADRLLEKIRILVRGGIEIHGQIVLCPGINDGEKLKESVESLARFFPAFRSLAVVPVGLTRHRKGLPQLHGVDAQFAKQTIKIVRRLQSRFRKQIGDFFVYLADEFYLQAGKPLPAFDHYGDFWQVENGVGMIRAFLNDFKEASRTFPQKLDRPRRYVWVTGRAAGPILKKKVIPRLCRIGGLRADVCVVPNTFYGETVTVSGLLTGRDIVRALQEKEGDFIVLLPPNCLSSDGLFLDDWTVQKIEKRLRRKVVVVREFEDLWKT